MFQRRHGSQSPGGIGRTRTGVWMLVVKVGMGDTIAARRVLDVLPPLTLPPTEEGL